MTPDTRFVHQIRAVARQSEMDAGAVGFGIPPTSRVPVQNGS